ncbi:CobW family GTP-binding protein [Demequina sediminicola]|uniref:CobW family GTP-binding protein n=1 Tax=Demequina sediminicola TaxID=1095026 RepID=UPI0009E5E714|nr:GTP-binding protein [Demequina sediminicola]
MTPRLTVSILSTMDPVIRAAVSFSVALERSDTVVVHHDLVGDEIRRVVSDSSGIIEQDATTLEHACLGCAIREDLTPTLERLQMLGRWSTVLVALPVTAESAPVTRAIDMARAPGGSLNGVRLGTVMCAVDADTIAEDAFSSDFLHDRGLALVEDDYRVVAEAVAPMLAHADVVALVCDGSPSASASATVDHLRGRGSHVLSMAAEVLDGDVVARAQHRCERALGRIDPLRLERNVARDRDGIWSVELKSAKPFHPGRLRERLADLGSHNVRARGHFWVPTRPDNPCAWDAAGRQVSVGSLEGWESQRPGTRIVFTGRGPERDVIAQAFRACLIRDDERSQDWSHGDDLSDWLGPVER